jgi:glutamate-1-semialdehyde aminotransferase
MLHQLLLDGGVYLRSVKYERNAISTVHTEEDIAFTIQAFGKALERLS